MPSNVCRTTALLSALSIPAAHAALISTPLQDFSLTIAFVANPFGFAGDEKRLFFAPFDASLGVLDKAVVRFNYGFNSHVEATGANQSPETSATLRVDYYGSFGFRFTDDALYNAAYYERVSTPNASCDPGFGAPCTASWDDPQAENTELDIDAFYLPAFSKPDRIGIRLYNDGSAMVDIFSPSGAMGSGLGNSEFAGQLGIDYIYTAVAEPPVQHLFAMLGIGFVVFRSRVNGRLLRREPR